VNGRAVALGLCLLATVAGCSTEKPALGKENPTSAKLCATMRPADVGDILGVRVETAKPQDINTKGVLIAVRCMYQGDPAEFSFVQVGVDLWRSYTFDAAGKVKEAFTAADGTPGEYETVADLGDAAGFGPSPDFSNQYLLTVATEYSDGYREVTVEVDMGKKPGLDQLRQIAEQVLQKLDAS
jgi:hypothetical protein